MGVGMTGTEMRCIHGEWMNATLYQWMDATDGLMDPSTHMCTSTVPYNCRSNEKLFDNANVVFSGISIALHHCSTAVYDARLHGIRERIVSKL